MPKTIRSKFIFMLLSSLLLIFTLLFIYLFSSFNHIVKTGMRENISTLSDSIFLSIRTSMNFGSSQEVDKAVAAVKKIKGIEDLEIAKSKKVIELFNLNENFDSYGAEIKRTFATKESRYIENGDRLRLLRPIEATKECLGCHVNAKEGEVLGVMRVDISTKEIESKISSLRLYLVSGILLSIVVLVFLFLHFFNKNVFKPLRVLKNRAADLAQGEGDLTKRLNFVKKDEIGEAGRWIDAFIEKIKEVVEKAKEAGSSNLEIAKMLEGKSEEIVSKLNEGIAKIQRGVSKGEKVHVSLRESLGAIERSKKSVENARERIKSVEEELEKLFEMIETQSKEGVELSMRLQKLSQRADSVKEVLNVIAEIADRTNLLALNAAIEAARSGEHGKGFAVVAEEVRRLAEQSRASLEDINETINEIVDEIVISAKIMAENSKELTSLKELATHGKESVEKSAELMEEMRIASEGSSKISQMLASEVEDILKEISKIEEFSRENIDNVQQMKDMIVKLSKSAENLDSILERFKT